MFLQKLRSFNINNKLFLYSKIKKNYIIEPFIENSNFENRKLIVKMRISDHVLEIERGRYNKINREQRICRQCHLNVIEDEEHFIFHCQKIIKKGIFNPD
jgi:exosome complex RNA-binding protein Rrp42 (RNase PH superfamily)